MAIASGCSTSERVWVARYAAAATRRPASPVRCAPIRNIRTACPSGTSPDTSTKPRMPRRSGVSRRKDPRLQDTVRLSADGLAKVLGDLEARVMAAVWKLNRPAPARAVHTEVVRRHPVALLTVVTVLNKLVAKGLLRRAKRQDLLHYEAILSEEELTAHASRRIVEGILSLGSEAVTTSMVDVLAEQDPEQLADMARLIRRRLRSQEG